MDREENIIWFVKKRKKGKGKGKGKEGISP
jgi:hypothetical protein